MVEYKLVKKGNYPEDKKFKVVGELKELYLNLPSLEENIYTDGHTRKKEIKIGEVYKEDEDKIDLDNTRDCSNGLHVGSHSFGFSGFGDTGVVALVNPMKVRSVPKSDTNKMRVSEMFIVGVVELDEYKKKVLEGEISDYSDVYFNTGVEELEGMLKDKSFAPLTCQENVPAVSVLDIKSITEQMKKRVVNV